jgi:hypothetical protein
MITIFVFLLPLVNMVIFYRKKADYAAYRYCVATEFSITVRARGIMLTL